MAEHMHLFSTTSKNEDLKNYVKYKDEIWRILMLLRYVFCSIKPAFKKVADRQAEVIFRFKSMG